MRVHPWFLELRRWLGLNKVFFETLAALLLSGMAVVVALESNQLVSQQTHIMRQQTALMAQQTELLKSQSEVMRLENLPRLHVVTDFEWNESISLLIKDKIIISNIGSPLDEFSVTDKVFLEVAYGEKELVEMKKVLVPVNSYYGVTVPTKMPSGEQATLFNGDVPEGNWRRLSRIKEDFRAFAQKHNAYGFISIKRYVRATYKDVFGIVHKEFFLIDNSQTIRLSEVEGSEMFQEFDTKLAKAGFPDFKDISAQWLYEKWKLYSAESPK